MTTSALKAETHRRGGKCKKFDSCFARRAVGGLFSQRIFEEPLQSGGKDVNIKVDKGNIIYINNKIYRIKQGG